jgi:membrane-associated protease RseP (regulator of RpoE activity)
MQTTYFRVSYQELAKTDVSDSSSRGATPGFAMVDDMQAKAREMYGEGYTMLGYSQFISPLYPSLAQDYSTKWGKAVGSSYVVLETPRKGQSNLHYYLVTYWSPVDTRQFTFGAYLQDLPPDLLKRLGPDFNVVMVQQVVQGTAAGNAGILADDAILAVDGRDVPSTQAFVDLVNTMSGREIVVTISRAGKIMDIPVQLGGNAPVAPNTLLAAYHDAPWRNTEPNDWSGLSAAAISKAAVENHQRMEQQRQLEYERAQLEAMRRQAYLDAQRANESSYSASGRRGGNTRGTPQSGFQMPSDDELRKNWEKWREDYLRNQ